MERLKSYIKDSAIYKVCNKLSDFRFENTAIYRFLNTILNRPFEFLSSKYNEPKVFADSFFMKILKWFLKNLWFVNGIVLIMVLIIPHTKWNNGYLTICMFIILVLLILRNIIFKNKRFNIEKSGIWFYVFVFSIICATVVSVDFGTSVRQLIFYLTAFLAYINLISSVNTKRELRYFLYMFYVMIILVSLYGLYQWRVGVPVNTAYVDVRITDEATGRIYSTVDNPNNLAELLLLGIPLCGALALSNKKLWKIIILCGPIVFAGLAMILTGTRTGWGALFIAFAIFVMLWDKRFIPLFIICAVLGFVMLPKVSPSTYKRILTVFNKEDRSMEYRTIILDATTPLLKTNWLTGIGLGSQNYSRQISNVYDAWDYAPPHSHVTYLQIWVEAGVFAILSFVLMITTSIIKSFRGILRSKDLTYRNILIGSLAAIVGICIMGFLDYIFFYPRIMYVFFIVLAIIDITKKLELQEV